MTIERETHLPGLPPLVITRTMRVIILGWFFCGVALLVGLVVPIEANPILNGTPWYLEGALGFFLVAGSTLASLSVVVWKKRSTAWKLEKVAWPMLIAAWGMYDVTSLFTRVVPFALILGVSFLLASIVRLAEVITLSKMTRGNVEVLNKVRRDSDA